MLRLIEWYPDQVSKSWHILKPMIGAALPPISMSREDRMNKVLDAILSGRLDVHVCFDFTEEKSELYGVIVTTVIDIVDGTDRQLLVYAVYGYRKLIIEQVLEVFELIKKLAKSQGCTSISGYTNIPKMIEYVKQMGWEANYTFCRVEV